MNLEIMVEISQPTPEDRARAYRTRLKDEPHPAVILDCTTADVLAANAGGLSALGLTPANRLPAPLDSAMPAIVALRELVDRGLKAPIQKSLMFWKSGRVAAWPCFVSGIDPFAPSHVLVVFHSEHITNGDVPVFEASSEIHVALDGLAANDDAPPPILRDDGETLKEIARRIREAQRVLASNAEPAPTPATPASTDPSTTAPAQSDLDKAAQSAISQINLRDTALPPSDIAKLAHELKTPLTAIAAAAEIMRDEQLGAMGNEKYLGYAADIHASATHALAVIGEMLTRGANAHNDQPLDAPFDLTELANSTVSALQPLAAQRNLQLAIEAEADLMPIRANATAVRQILLNLLTNALKFTPPGGDVRVVTGYLNDGAVFLVVRDTGNGMDERTLQETFDDSPERMTMRAGGGRGIGLRLVRRLAAENGAEFEIDSAPGRGTVVLLAFAKDLSGPRR